jgi:putative tryptophan/tyrosine transport system substrate-binding protein
MREVIAAPRPGLDLRHHYGHHQSPAIRAGGLIFCSGMLPVDPETGNYVDRILKGGNPGDLPIQFPTKYELVVNLDAAKAIGLTLPASFLLRADKLIE